MTEKQELITKLAEGYSTQSKTTNTFWIVLIVASIIGLVGRQDNDNLIELPFTLGRVTATDFYAINIVLISVVIIAFSSAMVQTIRTRMLVQKAIDDLSDNELFVGKVHMQDFFDSVTTPTYSKVAPIAQFLLGKNQFFGEPKPSKSRRRFAKWVYLILKYSTFAFLYLIPSWALVKCWANKNINTSISTLHIPNVFLIFIMSLAAASVIILLLGDIKHIRRASKKITS
jgi:hypothetical protein